MKRVVIGISGASGVIYGIRLLEVLRGLVETHLIMTDAARKIITMETDLGVSAVEQSADYCYVNNNLAAPVASGSFLFDCMVILPCSIKSMSAIAHSYADNLLVRTADVALKERRRLILCIREMPFSTGHLQLMTNLSNMGAIICPPIPAFYNHPRSTQDIIDFVAGKIVDLLGIEHSIYVRWQGDPTAFAFSDLLEI